MDTFSENCGLKRCRIALAIAALLVGALGCQPPAKPGSAPPSAAPGGGGLGASNAIKDLMAARGLSEADVEGALKTYVPSGKRDEYMIFASGGHGGQVLVMGVPSMRLLKVIGVFAPEPWQGYGYGGGSSGLLDAAGQVVNRYEYDDFGELLSAQELVANPFAFAGRERDPETGLYAMRARTYDPRTGRFLQPDPSQGSLRVPLTQAPYVFARNDPYGHTDPLGTTAVLEYSFKLAEIFGFGANATAPNGYELIGSLIGFFQGFGATNLVFLGNILGIANNGGDLLSQWGDAIAATAAKMEEIKGTLGYLSHLDDSGFVGGFINGAHFEVGIKFSAVVEPPEPVGDLMDIAGVDNPLSWKKEYKVEKDYGGFGNGVSNALDYLRLVGPH